MRELGHITTYDEMMATLSTRSDHDRALWSWYWTRDNAGPFASRMHSEGVFARLYGWEAHYAWRLAQLEGRS